MSKGVPKQIGLDAFCSIACSERDQIGEGVGAVGATGGDVEHTGEHCVMVVNRNGGAAQKRVASEEVLVAVDGQRPLLDEAGADPVGALKLLAPHSAGP